MENILKRKEILDQLLKNEIVQVILTMIKENTPVTMDKVARQCGVSKGTLYNHFQNKEQLLDHVYRVILEPLLGSNQQIFEYHCPPLTQLLNFIDLIFEKHESISIYFLFVWQNKTAETVHRDRIEALMHPLAKICQEGIDNGDFINVDPYILAEIIYGATIGTLTTLNYRESAIVDRKKILQDVKKIIKTILCRQQKKNLTE